MSFRRIINIGLLPFVLFVAQKSKDLSRQAWWLRTATSFLFDGSYTSQHFRLKQNSCV
jgi:hypothetical protein